MINEPTTEQRPRRVVVSGASSGIGRATAVRFAAEEWDVCATARREPELRSLLEEMPLGQHLIVPGDYSQPETATTISEAVMDNWGSVDCLVNCAGVSLTAPAIEAPIEEWRRAFDIMINGAVYLTRALVPLMSDGGRVIHITSIHGERAEAGSSSYAMAKAALNQYCRALAVELAPRGILVNAIAPGFIDTPMSMKDGVNEMASEWFKKNYIDGHHLPLRRAGQPEEVAGVAYFLAGPDATYITGQVITVDGGLTITF
jgi:3-oxoacyl-[acyl-carrier protein] reductase